MVLSGESVGVILRTRRGIRLVHVHAAWRTTPDVARSMALLVPVGLASQADT